MEGKPCRFPVITRTHSAGNGPEGGHPLNVVGVAAAEGITLGVLAPLQDKLLSLVGGVLVADPAGETQGEEECALDHSFRKINGGCVALVVVF